jgi:hypothetical protein
MAMSDSGRRPLPRKSAATLVLGLFLTLGLVVVFSGTLTRSTGLETEAERSRAELAALQARVESGAAELAFVDSEAFVEQSARSIGFGEPGEQPFDLEPNAPSPAPIVPLGSVAGVGGEAAPFDAWMELLFGA